MARQVSVSAIMISGSRSRNLAFSEAAHGYPTWHDQKEENNKAGWNNRKRSKDDPPEDWCCCIDANDKNDVYSATVALWLASKLRRFDPNKYVEHDEETVYEGAEGVLYSAADMIIPREFAPPDDVDAKKSQ